MVFNTRYDIPISVLYGSFILLDLDLGALVGFLVGT
jgi:hypothetical protein